MKKKQFTALLAASFAAVLVCTAVVRHAEKVEARQEAQTIRNQQRRSEEIQAQRKAQLVQRINRYWQLRDEAVRRGIDLAQVPVMSYVVGRDGNIYRLLPDGQCQLMPDDLFHDPDDLYAQQWTQEQAQGT